MSGSSKTFKILFTGGGTAGHLYPIIAVVRELKRLNFKADFYYIGPKDEFVDILLPDEGIKVKTISTGKIRRYVGLKSFLQNALDILIKIPLGFLQALFSVFFLNPDITFSKGGYGSLAPVFWVWFFRGMVFLHESDVAPGLTNRISNRFAAEIFTSFPVSQMEYFPAEKMIAVGNPIRRTITKGSADKAKELFYLRGGKKGTVLILGGSQGAQKINDLILRALPQLLSDFELIHQTGDQNFQQVKAEARVVASKELLTYYHPTPFLKEIETKHAYAAADLVVSRAGSGAIFEIAACKKPSILIPLALAAQEHQSKNAYVYARSGAAIVLEEANLTPSFFLERIKFLFARPQELAGMKRSAEAFARPDSARIIASYIAEYLEQ